MPLLSIIVPVYNCEQYLKENIESILGQSLEDFEVIYVDDGSSDSSLQLLKSYEKKDKRIRVLEQENMGPSAARNAGLKIAEGSYIGFVDGDDTIDGDYFRLLYEAASGDHMPVADIEGTEFFEGERDIKEFPELFYKWLLHPVWNKLFKGDVLRQENIYFDRQVKMGEDILFVLDYIEKGGIKGFRAAKGAAYHYRRDNEGSLSRREAPDRLSGDKRIYAGAVRRDFSSLQWQAVCQSAQDV